MTKTTYEYFDDWDRKSVSIHLDKIKIEHVEKFDGPYFLKAVQRSRDELAPYFKWAKQSVTWDAKYAKKFVEDLAAGHFGQEHFKVMYRWEMIGYVGIRPLKYKKQAEIVIWVTTGFDGVGVAKLVAQEIIKSCFEDRGYELLEWNHLARNKASASVAESCGFRYVGQFMNFGDEDNDKTFSGDISRWIQINPSLSSRTNALQDPIFTLRTKRIVKPLSQSRRRMKRSVEPNPTRSVEANPIINVRTNSSPSQIRNMIDACT
jgi:RimJ/RimL family protein N-acetyltransferase